MAEHRAYLADVRERAERNGGVEPGSELAGWLEWAEGYVETIDPLPKRVLKAGQVVSRVTARGGPQVTVSSLRHHFVEGVADQLDRAKLLGVAEGMGHRPAERIEHDDFVSGDVKPQAIRRSPRCVGTPPDWGRIGGHLGIANLKELLAKYRLGSHSMTETHPNVAREVSATRRASIGSIFGEEGAERWASEGPRLFPIIDGWAPSTTPDEIRESVRTIERLQAAFEVRMGLEGSARDEFRGSMPNWIARRLLYRAPKAHRAGHRQLGTTLFRAERVPRKRVSPIDGPGDRPAAAPAPRWSGWG